MRIWIYKLRLSTAIFMLMTARSAMAVESNTATEVRQSRDKTIASLHQVPPLPFATKCESLAPVVEKVAPAVVRIVTAFDPNSPANLASRAQNPVQRYTARRALGARSQRPLERGLGAGVIVTEDGYILTSSHVVDGASVLEVTLQDRREFKARLIGVDNPSDIALIKVDANHLPTLLLAESRNVRVGDLVLAIGHPFGMGQSVTHGIVSAIDRGGMGIDDFESFIQTDAPINPGNSGGALVDSTGRLIGINTAILSSSGGNLGIGFAVPSDLAQKVLTDLLKHGYVVRGYLGIDAQDLTPELAREFKVHSVDGVLVGAVTQTGPAEKAGVQVGDVITEFNGKEILDSRQLKFLVAEARPGQPLSVKILRNGSPVVLPVTIGQQSKDEIFAKVDWTLEELDPSVLHSVILGELNGELRQQLQIPRDVKGAVVLDLHAYSAAGQAGLRPGDVIQSLNRQDVSNAAEATALAQNARHRRVLLRVWSTSGSHFILIEG
ncbi:MAG: peptidase S1 [Verrucomicrobia bacterium]|nr:MAG: peptidase S1 [Verrucomicrobiota bacterium]